MKESEVSYGKRWTLTGWKATAVIFGFLGVWFLAGLLFGLAIAS